VHLIDGVLKAAVRCGILESPSGTLNVFARTIDDYPPDMLIDILKTVVIRSWTPRDDAVRAASRYLEFDWTGKNIDAALRTAMTLGIRRGELERERKCEEG
jgi:hypothetical protein